MILRLLDSGIRTDSPCSYSTLAFSTLPPQRCSFGTCRVPRSHPARAKLPCWERVVSFVDLNGQVSIANFEPDLSRVKVAILERVAPLAFSLMINSHAAYRRELCRRTLAFAIRTIPSSLRKLLGNLAPFRIDQSHAPFA